MKNNVVMLSSYKGGIGKSSIAINLAAALKQRGLNTCIVDLDDATSTATAWRENWARSNPDAPAEAVPPLPPVMHIVGRDANTQIESLARAYDIVVVDAGAGAPEQNRSAIRAADLLLIPVTPSHTDLQPTIAYCLEVATAQAKNSGRPKARLVLNRLVAGKASAAELVQAVTSPAFPVRPMSVAVPMRESLTRMSSWGVSAYEYPRATDLRPIFDQLASEVLEELGFEGAPTVQTKVAQRN